MDGVSPTFSQVNIVASDMAATVSDYRRLGVTVPETSPEWMAHHRNAEQPGGIDLDLDCAQFATVWDEACPMHPPRSAVFGFSIPTREAVEVIYRELTDAGYVGELPPHDAFFGSRYAITQDLNGNPIGLKSLTDTSLRRNQSPPE
jgi:hypothetical protein